MRSSAIRLSSCARSCAPVGVSCGTLPRSGPAATVRAAPDRAIPGDRPAPVTFEASHDSVIGEPAHRQRSPRLDQVQDVALNRREIESAPAGRQVFALREEELHQQPPGSTGIVLGLLHRRHYT